MVLRKTLCEFVVISDASPTQKVDKFAVSLPGFPRVSQLVSLWPRDAAVVRKVRDERVVTVDELYQMSSAVVQSPQPSVVQRQHIADTACSVQKDCYGLWHGGINTMLDAA